METKNEVESGKYEVIESPLESDKLVEISQMAEKRINAIRSIKKNALRLTNAHDWTDQGGKPYLQVSGAEKIARLFGISWRFVGEIQRKQEDNGHFSFEVPMEFVMKGASVEFRGSRSSKDPFFSVRYEWNEEIKQKEKIELPPSEIDRTDVMKAAITNTIGNGITRLLGIRNLTWEDLEEANIKREDVGKIEYKKRDSSRPDGRLEIKNPNDPASEAQIRAIHTCLKNLGIVDESKKYEKISKILGFDQIMESISSLTKGEAGKVIDSLQKEGKK